MPVLTVFKASAGSGKTFTLAVQYIMNLVISEERGAYAHILAVTFTNKATTEMKDRILSQLFGIGHGLASSNNYFEALCKSIRDDGAAVPDKTELRRRCREALHQILHDYNRFRVQTIDAFFQTILRGLAHELGLTANLQVELGDKEVLSKAVDRIIDRLQDDPVLLDWVMSLVRDQIDNNQRWDVTQKVKSFGSAIFSEEYLTHGKELEDVLKDDDGLREIISQIEKLRSDACEIVPALGNEIEQFMQKKGIDYADISNGNNLQGFVEKLKNCNFSYIPSKRINDWAADAMTLLTKSNQVKRPDLVAIARELSDLLSQVLATYAEQQRAYASAQQVLAHIKQVRLLVDIDQEVTAINAETSRFNLSKTPILLNKMIGESDAPFIFEKIGAELRHVMIDEFQDTSSMQWKNFRALLIESFAKGGSNLLVGDVKQSIYRWRGGDWRMLANIEHAVVPKPNVKTLDTNCRSARRVIEFNNVFFKQAAEKLDTLSADEIQRLNEQFSFTTAYNDVKQHVPTERPEAGYVRLQTFDSKQPDSNEDVTVMVINDLMEQVRTLHGAGLPYDQITILVRFNYDAQPIIDAFTRTEDMPAIVSDEAFLYASSKAVVTLVTALRVMDDPTDLVSQYFIATHYPDALPFEEQLTTLPLYALLETLYRRFALDKMTGQDAYLMGFFDAVIDYVHRESSDIHSFLRYWDEKLSTESIPAGQVNGIRIVTIHKAKGLEFHTVLIPFCNWPLEKDHRNDLLWCVPTVEPYAQLPLVPVTPSGITAKSIFASAYAREHLYSRLDELNTLYVGFTRARCNLYAWGIGNVKSFNDNKSRTVGDLISLLYPNGYQTGIPIIQVKKEDSQEGNRLLPQRQFVDVAMQSYPLTATFKQSNQSQHFVAQQTDETIDMDDVYMSVIAKEQQYLELGRLLHSVLQQIETEADISRVLSALEQDGIISRNLQGNSYVSVRRADLETWLRRGLQQPKVASWFSGQWRLFTECSIVSVDPDRHQPTVLRPDRVMVSEDERQVIVVDFKFGHPNKGYDDQVVEYMSLLQRMYPQAVVEGYLWFVYSSKVQPVTLKKEKTARSSANNDTQQLTLDF